MAVATGPDMTYICTVLECEPVPVVAIDAPEIPPEVLSILPGWSARDMALSAIDLVRVIGVEVVAMKKLREQTSLLVYGSENGMVSGRRARRVQNMDALLEKWVATIAGLATAHSHEEYTRADHGMDDCLEPLLDATIGDVRVFIGALTELLRADPRIPYIWWSPWASVVDPVVRKGPDGQVAMLRDDLAKMVAKKASRKLQPADWEKAMAGALRWRSSDQLKAVGTAIDKGGKPTLQGRQSCVFLSVELENGDEAMVVL